MAPPPPPPPGANSLELFSPDDRAYHFKAESDAATRRWHDAIAAEQARMAAMDSLELHGSFVESEVSQREPLLPAGAGAGRVREQGVVRYGHALKRTGGREGSSRLRGVKKEFWKREWLVLRDDGLLLRYRRANDATASRVLFAGEFDVAAIDGGGTHGHCVRLSPASLSHGRRTFLFDFFTAAEQRGWVEALRAAAATRAEGGRGDASGRDDILAGPIVAVELRLAAATCLLYTSPSPRDS